MNFYSVRKGRKPGIYSTWAECQAQTRGFSGAIFKKFGTKEEAQVYIQGEAIESKKSKESEGYTEDDGQIIYVYTDGSCIGNPVPAGAAAIRVENKQVVAL